MKRFFLNCSIRTRITFLYTIFAVILISIITCYAYFFATGLLKKQETFILQDSLGYLEKTIYARISSVNAEFIGLFDDDAFTRLYFKASEDISDKSEQIKLDNEIRTYLLSIKLRNHDTLDGIYLYTPSGDVYSSEYRISTDYDSFRSTPYYQAAMDNKNRLLYMNGNSEDLYMVRSFYYQTSGSNDGPKAVVGYQSDLDKDYSVMVFAFRKKYLTDIMSKEAEKRNTNVLIFDNKGDIIARSGDREGLAGRQEIAVSELLPQKIREDFEGEFEEDRLQIHISKMDLTGWNISYVYNMNLLYRQTGEIRKVAMLLFGLAVIVVFMIASFVSGTVTRPVRSLAKAMDTAIENNMEVEFHTRYHDEVAELGDNFATLMKEVSRLLVEVKRVENQKHAQELKALQAQINPHFLYNTLDMVYWLAKMENEDKIADLIADLADFFRLSLNKGEDITSVRKELDHVSKYLDIQKVRYDDSFDYTIELEEGLEEERIPKLILQPLAENCLIHGFEGIDRKGHIDIKVTCKDDFLLFDVTDNGSGMDSSICRQLNEGEYITAAKDNHGYAISNVKERIKLYSKGMGSVFYESQDGMYTKASIRFPLRYRESLLPGDIDSEMQ
ncbi:sensor histidine kinase [Butyrivibrio sp. MC2013]|uniref:sensor histidine kinase n=1 Tax=Butyrivibrio sp. MC2013 TaxID=1280686 RepID=UPI0004277A54|nr:sensor histidine kinase [Butyrivibrio sp. MC2013]